MQQAIHVTVKFACRRYITIHMLWRYGVVLWRTTYFCQGMRDFIYILYFTITGSKQINNNNAVNKERMSLN